MTRWRQVRESWPDRPIHLLAQGRNSGTFDYFREAILGKGAEIRQDYLVSKDTHEVGERVADDPDALAFFGEAYHRANRDRLRALAVDDEDPSNGDGPQLPLESNILASRYEPLNRPLLLYVDVDSLRRKPVREFLEFLLTDSARAAQAVGDVPLPAEHYERARKRLADSVTGSIFREGSSVGVRIEDLLEMDLEQLVAQDARAFEIKVAYLMNFGKYSEWPPSAFADQASPFVIGVLGLDSVDQLLSSHASRKTLHGRPVELRGYQTAEDISTCHILYLSKNLTVDEHKKAIHRVANLPVIVVGEGEDFLRTGGTISFLQVDSKIRFRISRSAAERHGLKSSSKIFQVAEVVD